MYSLLNSAVNEAARKRLQGQKDFLSCFEINKQEVIIDRTYNVNLPYYSVSINGKQTNHGIIKKELIQVLCKHFNVEIPEKKERKRLFSNKYTRNLIKKLQLYPSYDNHLLNQVEMLLDPDYKGSIDYNGVIYQMRNCCYGWQDKLDIPLWEMNSVKFDDLYKYYKKKYEGKE